jgi:hypothetical protein
VAAPLFIFTLCIRVSFDALPGSPARRRPDVRFRRAVDELEIEVRSDSGGRSWIVVSSRTFAEYMTERGQTLVQEAASDSVQAAGQAVLAACGH